MAIQTVTMRNALATAYKSTAAFAALYTAIPTSTETGEVSGGSPAYARNASNWGTVTTSAVSASPAAFNVPASTTIQGAGFHSAGTAGVTADYLDGGSVTQQAFASQGTYTLTATYTQS